MKKVIAAINMTLDGFCDHTAGIPDEEIHHHYANLLNNAGVVLYGRITNMRLLKACGCANMNSKALIINTKSK